MVARGGVAVLGVGIVEADSFFMLEDCVDEAALPLWCLCEAAEDDFDWEGVVKVRNWRHDMLASDAVIGAGRKRKLADRL